MTTEVTQSQQSTVSEDKTENEGNLKQDDIQPSTPINTLSTDECTNSKSQSGNIRPLTINFINCYVNSKSQSGNIRPLTINCRNDCVNSIEWPELYNWETQVRILILPLGSCVRSSYLRLRYCRS